MHRSFENRCMVASVTARFTLAARREVARCNRSVYVIVGGASCRPNARYPAGYKEYVAERSRDFHEDTQQTGSRSGSVTLRSRTASKRKRGHVANADRSCGRRTSCGSALLEQSSISCSPWGQVSSWQSTRSVLNANLSTQSIPSPFGTSLAGSARPCPMRKLNVPGT